MKRIFAAEMKRTINAGWLIGILGVCFSICFDSWNDLIRALESHSGTVHYFFWNSALGGACRTFLVPVFAALPFAVSFCRDYKERALLLIVSREGKKSYCTVKYIINALCGGLVAAIATGILLLFLSSQFPMAEPLFPDITVSTPFHAWIALNRPLAYGLIEMISGFLRGILWSSIALCVSVYISDPLVVLASPYFISFVVVQAYRIFALDERYRLDLLLTGYTIIHSSVYTVLICMTAVCAIVALLGFWFRKTVVRRMENGMYY